MICEICKKSFDDSFHLSLHIKNSHKNITVKDYYDKYIKVDSTEGICPCCGKETKFNGITKKYAKYCSITCKQKCWNDVYRQTMLKKYGKINSFQLDFVKEKSENTKNEKYGDPYPTRWTSPRLKSVMVEKYGENWISDMSKKGFDAFQEKYGVKNPSQNYAVKIKAKITKFKKNNSDLMNYEHLIEIDYDKNEMECKCLKCNNNFLINPFTLRRRLKEKIEPCTICNPIIHIETQKEQLEFLENIKSFYKKTIIINDRRILNGKELDFYFPEEKIAIEFDGLYWHSEYNKPEEKYHLWKTEECEKRGIQLIHVFEDEWKYKPEIVLSRFKSILGLNEKIYGRKTIVKEITYAESEKFLNENHIQGNCVSKYRYGLFFNNELVSVMTFGESRFKKKEFELLRFANKLGINVLGGASKLFKHFLKEHNEIQEIVSFADRRWSIGKLYEKRGFKFLQNTKINYEYIIDGIRHNRMKFQKHKLKTFKNYETSKTEHQIMLENNFYRIYDCGQKKYIFVQGQNQGSPILPLVSDNG